MILGHVALKINQMYPDRDTLSNVPRSGYITAHDQSMVESHVALKINQMYPDRDTLSNVTRSGYITAHDQSMVESVVTEGGKNTASFLFRERTQQHKHKASS